MVLWRKTFFETSYSYCIHARRKWSDTPCIHTYIERNKQLVLHDCSINSPSIRSPVGTQHSQSNWLLSTRSWSNRSSGDNIVGWTSSRRCNYSFETTCCYRHICHQQGISHACIWCGQCPRQIDTHAWHGCSDGWRSPVHSSRIQIGSCPESFWPSCWHCWRLTDWWWWM